jgi:outer membrane protein TolC
VLKALKEVEQALTAYASALDQHQALLDARRLAHRGFDIAHNQFLSGSVSNLDLLTAEDTVTSSDAAVAESDAALVQDQIAVFKALGGGWRTAPAPNTPRSP